MKELIEKILKATEALSELCEKVIEVIKRVWNAIQPFLAKLLLASNEMEIVNHRGRNKLVYIRRT